MWWEFFHRCGFTEEEHVESRATLGALTCVGEAGQVKRSVIPVPRLALVQDRPAHLAPPFKRIPDSGCPSL